MIKRPLPAAFAGGIVTVVFGIISLTSEVEKHRNWVAWLLLGPAAVFFLWGLVAPASGWRPLYYGFLAAGVYIGTYHGVAYVVNLIF